MKRQTLKESRFSEIDNLIDILVNSMELFDGPLDFHNDLSSYINLDKKTLMNIYNQYWKVPVMKRFHWDKKEWTEWLQSNFGLKEEVVKEEEEDIFTVKQESRINKEIILEIGDRIRLVKEGINDKNILKAVFLAGGPGSGKSFIASQMFGTSKVVSPFGVKVINSDFFFEMGLAKNNLPTIVDIDNKPQYDKQMTVRSRAKKTTELKKGYHIDSMLPIIIDGTGKNFDKLSSQAEFLKSKGYDVSMVFINTSLETALKRNNMRARVVPENIVTGSWRDVQNNLGLFQRYFGVGDMVIVDNNDYREPGSKEAKDFMDELFYTGKTLIEKPLKNPKGKEIISILRDTGGKYLSDIPIEQQMYLDRKYS